VQSTTTDDELVMDDFAPHVAVIGDVYKCDSKVFVIIEKNIVLRDMSFFFAEGMKAMFCLILQPGYSVFKTQAVLSVLL